METAITEPAKKIERYIVMTASAKMPANCWGYYRKVAVVETDQIAVPKMISTHARHCVRVVRVWDRLNVGRTSRSAYSRAKAAATELANQLNHA